MYMGQSGTSTTTFVYERETECFICQKVSKKFTTQLTKTLREFLVDIKSQFRLTNPAVTGSLTALYMPKPPSIEAMHRHKLDLTFQ